MMNPDEILTSVEKEARAFVHVLRDDDVVFTDHVEYRAQLAAELRKAEANDATGALIELAWPNIKMWVAVNLDEKDSYSVGKPDDHWDDTIVISARPEMLHLHAVDVDGNTIEFFGDEDSQESVVTLKFDSSKAGIVLGVTEAVKARADQQVSV